MRSLSSEYRIQIQSIPEIRESLDQVALDFSREFEFQGRKMALGPMVNAVVLYFLSLTNEEQRSLVHDNLAKLEGLLIEKGDEQVKEVKSDLKEIAAKGNPLLPEFRTWEDTSLPGSKATGAAAKRRKKA